MEKRKNISAQLEHLILKRYKKNFKLQRRKSGSWSSRKYLPGVLPTGFPQMVIEVKVAVKIHQCGGCMRFLFWDEFSRNYSAEVNRVIAVLALGSRERKVRAPKGRDTP
ncbi:MAG: hypothetical protein Ct9H300mP23_03450 [Nitrospinota bacterium]|nr:MAG: hypothetical protein Ct9H300mP23_03450 [Nitrospinota bacterium]